MCQHDIVVFESGLEDLSVPESEFSPLRDPSLTRLGSGDMQVSLAQALTRMRSDVASPSSSYSADSPTA